MKRIDGPTPNGGAYAEIYYVEENGKSVDDSNLAVKAYGCEYDKNGKLINETFFVLNDKTEKKMK